MTSSPSAEAPRFRGKTLSPESPRPVHIPEPQNIPVLQNQIDPHFNLMSTHVAQSAGPPRAVESNDALQQFYPNAISPDSRFTETDTRGTINEGYESIGDGLKREASHHHVLADEGETSEIQKGANTTQNHLNFSNTQPFTTLSSYESFSAPAKNSPTPLPSGQIQNPNASNQDSASTSEKTQDAFVTQSSNARPPGLGVSSSFYTLNPDSDVNSEGVNYQALLENLSPSASTALPAEIITSVTTTASSRNPNPPSPSSLQTPITTLPIPAGLPARPPPQEKPAIHPNYTPGEDIRSYHKPPAQIPNSAPAYNPQPSNPQRPSQGYIHSSGVAPNGLPPPPLATFQQPMPPGNQPQRSPQTQQFRQTDNHGRHGGRSAPDKHASENQYPGRPDIEKLYEQFLQDEAIYVSEGTWDRFPQGSRLFVGESCTNTSPSIK